jgi:hypothetical protein
MSSIKAVRHELVLKIESLPAAAFKITSTEGASCLAHYHIIICGGHIIENLILQLTLNYYSLSLQLNRFLVVRRNLSISENVVVK